MPVALYYMPISDALVPYVALTEAGASLEGRVLNYSRHEPLSAAFSRLKPAHVQNLLAFEKDVPAAFSHAA